MTYTHVDSYLFAQDKSPCTLSTAEPVPSYIAVTTMHADFSSNSCRFCQFRVFFVHFGLGQASPGAFRGAPCTFCVPRVHFSSDLAAQGCPWSTTWALFGVTSRTFADTLGAHGRNDRLYGHPGWFWEAKCLESDVGAPGILWYKRSKNLCFHIMSPFL